ncbi:MAG: 2-C-methyl-D-erythritol 4-phosphate cytidylyltransferase [Clostridia bacterium]|nr:2-C-methyl-D-erythritol 4-phosphate cytidylyltransferase [Clostridia bacterium]
MKVKKAIIPAAGLGTRFLPITKAIPKPMLTVLNKPVIQLIVDELLNSGIEDIGIIVGKDADVIKNHFADNLELVKRLTEDGKTELLERVNAIKGRAKITFIEQKVANGLAGAIIAAEDFINNEPFAMLLGDEFLYTEKGKRPCIGQLIDVFEESGKNVLSTMEVSDLDVSKYGNLGIEKITDKVHKVYDIVEKPTNEQKLSNYAIIGRYVFASGLVEELKKLTPRNNEIYLTDTLLDLAKQGKVLSYEFDATRYDVGDLFGYVKANIELALKEESLVEETKKLIKELNEKI